MKTKKLTFGKAALLLLLFLPFAWTSCQDNSDIDIADIEAVDETVAADQAEIDAISEGINALSDEVYSLTADKIAAKDFYSKDNYLPECVSVTREITPGHKKIILDFGEGCETRNGDSVKGKLIMEFNFNLAERTLYVEQQFDDFYFNDKKIEGNISKVKIRINDEGKPEATITKDLKITWPDGTFATVKGERTRIKVDGLGNSHWGDDVFSITGSWEITYRDGKTRTVTVVEPLRKEMSCRFIVSGVVEIKTKDGLKMQLDYGDGSCDDLATLTVNGTTKEIHLKKKR